MIPYIASFKRASWVANGIPATIGATGTIALLGIISGITLARCLGPTARGELASGLLWANILALFGEFGLGFAFSYYSGKGASIGALWTLSVISSLGFGFVLGTLAYTFLPFTSLAGNPGSVRAIRLAIFSLPWNLLASHQVQLLLGTGRIAKHNSVRLYMALSYTCGIAILGVTNNASVMRCIGVFVFSHLTSSLLSTFYVIRTLRPRWALEPAVARAVYSYGAKTFMASLASNANLRLDQAIMSLLLVPAQLGYYVVAVSVANVLAPLYSAVSFVNISRTAQSPDSQISVKHTVRNALLVTVTAVPITLVGVLICPHLLPLVFGKAFAPSVRVAQVLLIASVFQGLNIILGSGLRGVGLPGLTALAEFTGLIVTVSLLFLLLRRIGIMGAGVASLCAYVTVMLVQLLMLVRHYRATCDNSTLQQDLSQAQAVTTLQS